ncbi:sulfotransferase family protein [Ruegeria lacuscaerulensis]|uniref:sulfotransferase family protein n=1 Tax=Ruegeria lacuscaerulensis TaxID=55218 RepID=UPI00147CAB9D|nr:sulfotransferase family protein [Ruegeria lacuscaerulensis]
MRLKVVGAGIGRTGTYSLKIALNQLGVGPCYHMEEVLHNMSSHLPLWQAAVQGNPDWPAIYQGYQSAVDWPTARFFRELYAEYPKAKFILGYRSPQSWAESFSQTIYQLLSDIEKAPAEQREWLTMVTELITQNGIPPGLDVAGLENAFIAHTEAVKAEIPAGRLLVFEAKDGWEPLCLFLGVPVPDEPFPRTNNRNEFWELVKGAP